MNLLLFGAPGAGKGTQSAYLVSKKNYFHISTGDLFRAAFKNETELGKKAKEYVDRGDLVPDSITVSMVEEVFEKLGEKSFILDGFPRNLAQAEVLQEMLGRVGKTIDKAVFLRVPNDVLLGRLTGRRLCKSCGAVYHIEAKPTQKEGICDDCGSSEIYQRADDKEDVIQNRLNTYQESTAPLIQYYKDSGKYVELDGMGEAEEVLARLETVLQS